MMTELKNVKVGRQDPKLFEIPEGFTKFDMAGMMGGMGGMMGGQGMRQPKTAVPRTGQPNMGRPEMPSTPDETTVEPEPPADDRSDMQKASDMMKKLFGQ